MIRFSIVTITYQAADVLGPTLESVGSQTYDSVEHLIIDGASTDGTLALARAYKERSDQRDDDHTVIIASQPDRGIYDAMNKGLTQASGDYVLFLNAGDRLPRPDTLSAIASHCRLNQTPSAELPGVLYGRTDLVDREGHVLRPRHLQPPEDHALSWQDFRQGMLVCHQAFYARTDIAKNNPYDTRYRYSADYDWCIRLMRETERAGLTLSDTALTVAHYLDEGTTRRHHTASLWERLRIMCRYYGTLSTLWRHVGFALRRHS